MTHNQKSRGFTLSKLLVVTAIIGLLVSNFLPLVRGSQEVIRTSTPSLHPNAGQQYKIVRGTGSHANYDAAFLLARLDAIKKIVPKEISGTEYRKIEVISISDSAGIKNKLVEELKEKYVQRYEGAIINVSTIGKPYFRDGQFHFTVEAKVLMDMPRDAVLEYFASLPQSSLDRTVSGVGIHADRSTAFSIAERDAIKRAGPIFVDIIVNGKQVSTTISDDNGDKHKSVKIYEQIYNADFKGTISDVKVTRDFYHNGKFCIVIEAKVRMYR